jgi:hypothetical protein
MLRSLILIVVAASACASTGAAHYQNALSAEEQCCRGLRDPAARDSCLAEIPRTEDQSSTLNQETFACVERHFRCDVATGRATRDSAQLQLDCLNDLESTQQARAQGAIAK